MIEQPDIAVLIVTYNRPGHLERTLLSLHEHLKYSGHIHYVIANDGEREPVAQLLEKLPLTMDWIAVGDEIRRGLGGNSNNGLQYCFENGYNVVLHTQDDYLALKDMELDQHVQKLAEDERAGWIRLKLLAGQDFTLDVRDRYQQVWWHSQSQYIASDQPHLKHRRFHDRYGFYREGVTVIETENEWCSRTKALGQQNPDWPKVLIPVEWPHDTGWLHIGDDCSWAAAGI